MIALSTRSTETIVRVIRIFVFTLFFVYPHPTEVVQGLIPSIPDVEGAGILIAAFVGTTMAAATFLSRPLFVQGKGWTINDFKVASTIITPSPI